MQANQEINWEKLVEAINNHSCVLVLGPNIATLKRDDDTFTLEQLLTEYLSKELLKYKPNTKLSEQRNLPYIARKLEDALLTKYDHHFGRAREQLCKKIQEFYKQYKFSDFPVYSAIAKLPFSFVVNTNPDEFLLNAYHYERKLSSICEYYHYGDPTHNNNIEVNKEYITPESPFVFNLFGSVEESSSMIITESDRLAFLDTILQKENTAGIPDKIAIEFTSSKEKGYEKTLVFLGFDFNNWHMPILMHLVNRYQKQKETYALQNAQRLSEVLTFFYNRNFAVNFVDFSAKQFADDFLIKIKSHKESIPDESPKLNAFLIFDKEDYDIKIELDKQLAPLKLNKFIETWDEEQIMGGSDRDETIKAKLNQADIILLLVTPNFFANDEISNNLLNQALKRYEAKETVVIPILMKSCDWQITKIKNITNILPRNRKALDRHENKETALADLIKQLEGWCTKIYNIKTRK